MNCDLNITGECNGELKCCALYAREHGPLCVCARQHAHRCDAFYDSEEVSIGMRCFSFLVMRSRVFIISVAFWAAACEYNCFFF